MSPGPDELSERVIMPMTKAMLASIEDYRYERRIPSRAEAMRRLIEAGLRAERPPNPKPDKSKPKR
jgi:metal-responsive CopG/Arc/MetJ family transcriptional regulator